MHLKSSQLDRFICAATAACLLLAAASGCIEVDEENSNGNGVSAVGIPCLVAAHYLMWWESDEGGHWDSGKIGDPLLGEYSSSSSRVISQHIDWASDYGIDVFAIQWSGDDNDTLIDLYLDSHNVHDMSFSIFYDCDIRFGSRVPIDFGDEDVYETFVEDLKWFMQRYSSHPTYFRIDGKPVIWIYAAGNFEGRWPDALAEVRNWAAGQGYPEPYLIGDMVWGNADGDKQERASNFSAVFAYTGYNRSDIRGQSVVEYAFEMTSRYYEWRLQLSEPVYPAVFPAYNDTAVRAGNPPIESQSKEDFEAMCYMGRQSSDRMPGSDLGLVFLASWNEWHEGTTVEPTGGSGSYPREYGLGHLKTISEVMKQ